MNQSETYTPVYSDEIAEEYSINYNPAVHGTSGPVQVSYPKYFYPQSGKARFIRRVSPNADPDSQSFRRDEPAWPSNAV